MNKDDFETSKRYPLIFPKAYAHADDFSWVVMEKATPLSRMDDMQTVLDKSFPAEQEAILQSRQAKNINPADKNDTYVKLNYSVRRTTFLRGLENKFNAELTEPQPCFAG